MFPIALSFFMPIITNAITSALNRRGGSATAPMTQGQVQDVARDVIQQVAKDPVAKNQMNLEPLYQSRVVWGTTTAFIVALGVVMTQITTMPLFQYEWSSFVPSAGIVLSTGYAFYGRVWGGLAPLFHKKSA